MKPIFKNKENHFRPIWKLAAGIGIIVISILLTMLIAEGLQLRHKSYNPFNLGMLIGTIIFLLVRYFIVGAGEELLFRVFLIGYFKKKINVIILILVSSTLFAAFHLLGQKNINLCYLFNIYIIGLFISLLYIMSNSFYLVFVYHVLHNTFNFHTDKFLPFRISFVLRSYFF